MDSLEALSEQNSAMMARLRALEFLTAQHAKSIEQLQVENSELKRGVIESDLHKVKAHTKPLSLAHQITTSPPANLLTVVQLEGFENLIAHCISPCTGNRRFAGKVGWNKLQKTCRSLRAVAVSLEMDPAVRIVPDNFPTIRRAIQNIDKHDKLDYGKIVVRPRPGPYTEQIVIDRRVALMADPTQTKKPVIHGRISMDEGARGATVKGFAVSNNNPRDPWGSAIDVNGAKDVHIENCELSSSSNDETVLKLSNCVATVRKNVICGGQTNGVIGISIHGKASATITDNTIIDNDVGVYLNPTATVRLKANRIERNYKGMQLNEEDIETIVDQGGFGRIMLEDNSFFENRDGRNAESFLKSLELLLHPLLRRASVSSLCSQGSSEGLTS
jgi:parallel beta-helix repeat protein